MSPVPPTSLRVAVLDDNLQLLRAVAAVLEAAGLNTSQFQDPAALVEEASSGRFDAFVLDWRLDGTTAYSLIKKLRSTGNTRDAPIFVLSGNLEVSGTPSDNEMAEAIEAFSVHYRSKPYPTRKLAREIVREVDNRVG